MVEVKSERACKVAEEVPLYILALALTSVFTLLEGKNDQQIA